jgi:hypothetical protein
LTSSVLKWPDVRVVDAAVRAWAARVVARRTDVVRIGYFGSYARGDWGVGSDVDLIIVADQCGEPFERRSLGWDTAGLPVPADVVVYSRSEWDAGRGGRRFAVMLDAQTVWVYVRDART